MDAVWVESSLITYGLGHGRVRLLDIESGSIRFELIRQMDARGFGSKLMDWVESSLINYRLGLGSCQVA